MEAKAPSVAVLGAGSWGTALAALIARHGHPTVLWGRDAATIEAIAGRHENPRYLPGIALPDSLRATTDLATALHGADLVLVVVPSHAFAETLRALAPYRPAHAGVAWATKGFEPGSGRFLHEVAGEVLGDGVPLAVVTGPSFAKEVAQGLPTALTVHSDDADFAQQVADVLHGPSFRAYTGDDMLGAELGGAMKNVLAVATGVAREALEAGGLMPVVYNAANEVMVQAFLDGHRATSPVQRRAAQRVQLGEHRHVQIHGERDQRKIIHLSGIAHDQHGQVHQDRVAGSGPPPAFALPQHLAPLQYQQAGGFLQHAARHLGGD